MRIQNTAVLLFLALAFPVLASSRDDSPLPPQESEPQTAVNSAIQKPLAPPTPSRGQLLYENHCMTCHESLVHIRTRQKAISLPALRVWVMFWAAYSSLHWSREDIEDVTQHLNSQYYKFDSNL